MAKDKWEKVESNFMKWGKEGDHVFGTFIGVRQIPNQLKDGELQNIYEIKSDGGEYHNIVDQKVDDDATTVEEGEIFIVSGKAGLDSKMRNIKLGTKVKFEFTETKPSKKKGFHPAKIIEVYTNGDVDEDWLKEKKAENSDWEEATKDLD